MNAQTNQIGNAVRMFTSFNRGIFVPLVGPNSEPVNVYNYLKEKNARISLEHVRGLMEGKEQLFKDFEVVTILDAKTIRGESIPAASPVASDTAQAAVAQTAPVTPTTPGLAPVRRLPQSAMGPQPATLQSGTTQISKGRGREYEPTGMIMPLKRGTVYAQIMEMLMNGATMKEMLAATGNVTSGGVNDVLSWQIKRRGYGLRFDQSTGKYHLVLPKGHTALVYQD